MANDRVRSVRLGDNLDRPLHRIFLAPRFEELIQSGQMALVKPSLWIDPREDPCAQFVLTPALEAGFQKPQRQLADYLSACWAQCWSTEAESDVLLRAYSRVELDPETRRNRFPQEEGIRATTTPRRLLAAMERWAAEHGDDHYYLAGVEYEPEQNFAQTLANRLAHQEGPLYFSTPDGRAESLCTKRTRFSDEREVRLLCVGTGQLGTGDTVRLFKVDPNALFTEIAFDPRLLTFEQRERAEKLQAMGFKGKIIEDPAYVGVFSLIPMRSDWPDPN
jgi:hypothetical protein